MALLDHDGQTRPGLSPRRRIQRPPPPPNDRRPPGTDTRLSPQDRCLELDCLIGLLPAQTLCEAAARARELETGADRVLIAAGTIDERVYLHHFAEHTGIAIETFRSALPSDIILRHDQTRSAAQSGLLPLRCGQDLILVVSPRHLAARNLMRAVACDPGMITRLRIADAEDFDAYLLHRSNGALAHDAAYALRDRMPALSAAPRRIERPLQTQSIRIAASFALAILLSLPPDFAGGFWSQWLAGWFVAGIGLRLTAALTPMRPTPPWSRLPDRQLPVYTVIVALYREARSVAQLLDALNALDYPREKLDIIFAVEPDDLATRTEIAGIGAMPHLRVMVVPDMAPRTKPKALNAVLPFARGRFIAVYDAEDCPDPGQLRMALDVFRTEGDDIACAQASLCIRNAGDSFFTRMFAAEYAGQFDAMLPGLAAMRLPLPLGGTSNHFRADALRDVGGWDAWNVTEDADLGLRLARCGYRTTTFASTTEEEAPITFPRWLRQRSRWMKGWMQTLSVHMRAPRQFVRETGWRGLATLNFIIAGPIVSALACLVLLGGLVFETLHDSRWLLDGLLMPMHVLALSTGYLASILIGLIGLARRGRLRDGWFLLLMPIYWLCLSLATWRALWQLLHDPYRWEKTEHGLTRDNSGSKTTRRHSVAQLPLGKREPRNDGLAILVTNTASNPPPPRPACVSG